MFGFCSEEEASRAFLVFNGRWYAQRQLSVQYTSVVNWKAAICGNANIVCLSVCLSVYKIKYSKIVFNFIEIIS